MKIERFYKPTFQGPAEAHTTIEIMGIEHYE